MLKYELELDFLKWFYHKEINDRKQSAREECQFVDCVLFYTEKRLFPPIEYQNKMFKEYIDALIKRMENDKKNRLKEKEVK
jgi:hypothetical protein